MTTLRTLTNQHPDFYALIGPFLANRAVVTHIGDKIWDDDDKTWIIAIDGGQVTGFVGIRTSHGLAHIESCYTTTGDDKLATRLVTTAIKHANPSPCAAVVLKEHAGPYLKAGFTVAGETARFDKLVRSSK